MTEAIGPNWMDYFSFCCFNAKKPGFFYKTDDPAGFKKLDGDYISNFDNFMEKEKVGLQKVIARGHASILSAYLKKKYGKDYKALFFGDTIVNDCVYSFDEHE